MIIFLKFSQNQGGSTPPNLSTVNSGGGGGGALRPPPNPPYFGAPAIVESVLHIEYLHFLLKSTFSLFNKFYRNLRHHFSNTCMITIELHLLIK